MAIKGKLLLQINQYVYVDKKIDTSAFTYFSQIRVLNEESAYISTTNGERTAAKLMSLMPCLCFCVCKERATSLRLKPQLHHAGCHEEVALYASGTMHAGKVSMESLQMLLRGSC